MPSSMFALLGSMLLALVVGVGLGMLLGSACSASIGPEDKNLTSPAASIDLARAAENRHKLLESQLKELERELSQPRQKEQELIFADRLDLFRRDHIKLEAFGDNLKITPELADVLKLSPREIKAIEQHLATIQNEVQQMVNSRMVLVKQNGGSVTYEIPSYPEGQELKTRLSRLVSSAIGENRADVFMNSAADSFQSQFFSFGEQKTQLQFDRLDGVAGGFQLTERYFNPDGSLDNMLSFPTDALPNRWNKLLQLGPAGP